MKRKVRVYKKECAECEKNKLQNGGTPPMMNGVPPKALSSARNMENPCAGTRYGGPECPKGSPQYEVAKSYRAAIPKEKTIKGSVAPQNQNINEVTKQKAESFKKFLSTNTKKALDESEMFNAAYDFQFGGVPPNGTVPVFGYQGVSANNFAKVNNSQKGVQNMNDVFGAMHSGMQNLNPQYQEKTKLNWLDQDAKAAYKQTGKDVRQANRFIEKGQRQGLDEFGHSLDPKALAYQNALQAQGDFNNWLTTKESDLVNAEYKTGGDIPKYQTKGEVVDPEVLGAYAEYADYISQNEDAMNLYNEAVERGVTFDPNGYDGYTPYTAYNWKATAKDWIDNKLKEENERLFREGQKLKTKGTFDFSDERNLTGKRWNTDNSFFTPEQLAAANAQGAGAAAIRNEDGSIDLNKVAEQRDLEAKGKSAAQVAKQNLEFNNFDGSTDYLKDSPFKVDLNKKVIDADDAQFEQESKNNKPSKGGSNKNIEENEYPLYEEEAGETIDADLDEENSDDKLDTRTDFEKARSQRYSVHPGGRDLDLAFNRDQIGDYEVNYRNRLFSKKPGAVKSVKFTVNTPSRRVAADNHTVNLSEAEKAKIAQGVDPRITQGRQAEQEYPQSRTSQPGVSYPMSPGAAAEMGYPQNSNPQFVHRFDPSKNRGAMEYEAGVMAYGGDIQKYQDGMEVMDPNYEGTQGIFGQQEAGSWGMADNMNFFNNNQSVVNQGNNVDPRLLQETTQGELRTQEVPGVPAVDVKSKLKRSLGNDQWTAFMNPAMKGVAAIGNLITEPTFNRQDVTTSEQVFGVNKQLERGYNPFNKVGMGINDPYNTREPVQYDGQYAKYGGSFQEGGEYELSDEEIEYILKNGGQIEFI